SNGSHIRIQRTEDRIHWGWIADIFFSVIAAYVNVVAFFLAGPLTIIQGLWAAALGGLAGPAFLVQLLKERWLHEVGPPSGGVDLKYMTARSKNQRETASGTPAEAKAVRRQRRELEAITDQILRSNSIVEIWRLKRRGRRILCSLQERRA